MVVVYRGLSRPLGLDNDESRSKDESEEKGGSEI